MIKRNKRIISVVSNIIIVALIILVVAPVIAIRKNQVIETANSEYKGVIYAGDKTSNNVCLMVNVYWGNESLVKMLDILKKYDIKTTFFVGGTWAEENDEILKRIYHDGHEIGSHGHTHKEHSKISYENNLTEIQICHEIVKKKLGINMELFAPPGGSYNANTIRAAEFLNYKTIMWTRDTIDWRDHDTNLIYNRAVTNMCGGDLILMHPTENTAEALTNIILYAKNHNYNLTTVSKVLGL